MAVSEFRLLCYHIPASRCKQITTKTTATTTTTTSTTTTTTTNHSELNMFRIHTIKYPPGSYLICNESDRSRKNSVEYNYRCNRDRSAYISYFAFAFVSLANAAQYHTRCVIMCVFLSDIPANMFSCI